MIRGVFALMIGLMLSLTAMAQVFSVSGTVKDKATGKTVEYATIALTDSEQWAVADDKGRFEIKNVYKKFHGDKFDIVSIAVWDKPENTLKAIEEEGLEWGQIIDCQKIPGELYGIEGIPVMILFGPDGTILERGSALRGVNMEATVSKYL